MKDTHADAPASRALLSSLSGTTVEWYEFSIYGTAVALVFNKLFFPEFDPLTGTLLSLSTLAGVFVARTVGDAVFGHFGDAVGRKLMLLVTLSILGVATLLIGVLPAYEIIAIAAAILLIILKFVQGLLLGGEYSGAVLMSVERAKLNRCGLYGGVVNSGAWWSLIIANLAFLSVALLRAESFGSWGWRILFLLSGVLVRIGLYIRLKVEENPEFKQVKESGKVQKTPLGQLLSTHDKQLILMALSYLSAGAYFLYPERLLYDLRSVLNNSTSLGCNEQWRGYRRVRRCSAEEGKSREVFCRANP
ncbi:MFS transporter [Nocardia sp. NPDC004750]